MKELSKKVFLLIYGMIMLVLLVSFSFINIQSYRREYQSVRRSLDIINDRGIFNPMGFPDNLPEGAPEGVPDVKPEGEQDEKPDGKSEDQDGEKSPFDLENMMIMDQEVYTVEISDGKVEKILGHGNESEDFDVDSIAESIISSYEKDTFMIGNLYFGDYAFNYRETNIVIINLNDICSKQRKLFLETAAIFVVLAGIMYFLSKLITRWITKPAREAFDRQREFIADASHELKTPLAVIMASSDEINADKDSEKYIKNIKHESDRMNKLISEMLDLSKLEEGIPSAEQKEENLSKIVEKTVLVFEGMAFESGVKIESDVEEGIIKKCSKYEMERLVSILLDNAIKHSYKDSTIHVNLKRNKNKTVLEVINAGDPIKEGEEEKIFERFYRADKARSRSENRYGLGLAIAKSIVQNYNGNIKAKSKDGKTTFRVEL